MPLHTKEEPIPQPVDEGKADVDLRAPRLIKGDADSYMQPDAKRPELVEMEKHWRLGDILLGGRDSIIAHSEEICPPLGDEEESGEREARLRKAINTPFYDDHIDRLVSRPFGRSVRFEMGNEQELPTRVAEVIRNADGLGKSISAMGRDHLYQAMHRGGDALMVDLHDEMEPVSMADETRRRPIVRRIPMNTIRGWEYEIDKEGGVRTTQLRLTETKREKKGFSVKETPGIRIIQAATGGQPGFIAFYAKNESGDWNRLEYREWKNDRIMLHATWTQQTSATSGKSPMTHLAELNASYIGADCEQQYGASYARVATMWTVAFEKTEQAGKLGEDVATQTPVRRAARRITRGHRRHIRLPEDAKVGMLEVQGGGLARGRAELDALEKRMEQFSSTFTMARAVTATQVHKTDDRDTSNLAQYCTRVEDTLTAVMQDVAELANEQLPAEFRAQVFRDWSQAEEREQAMPHTYAAYDRKLIPARKVHDQLRRYGIVGPDEKSDELLSEAQKEAQERADQFADSDVGDALERARKGRQGRQEDDPSRPPSDRPDDDGGDPPDDE